MARVKEWLLRGVLVAVSLLVALAVAEGVVRVVHPISDGRDNVTLDGVPITSWFTPGSVYRQVSNEYDARTTITSQGHRVPGSGGNPEVVFLGDSFTYGWGIDDEHTFASIYCTRTNRPCVNLGFPGTGTAKQLNRLEEFLDKYDWHPKEVKLIFFGMSGAWTAGNDFVDNYDERGLVASAETSTARPAAAAAPPAAPAPPAAAPGGPGLVERIIGLQTFVLGRSNLMRLVKFYWGPTLKSLLIAEPGEARFAQALGYTKANLARLDALSRARGFSYHVYLIVPVQDVINRTYPATVAALNSASPVPVISTADLFLDDPISYYYAYDGHINAKGAQKVGQFIVDQERGPTPPSQDGGR